MIVAAVSVQAHAVRASAVEPGELVSRREALMGGQVGVHVLRALEGPVRSSAETDAEAVLRRMARWADRLTRFSTTSELSQLNDDPRVEVPIGPTLSAVLDWARYAEGLTGGVVDIGLLDARLAAEDRGRTRPGDQDVAGASLASRSWSLQRRARGAVVRRPSGLRFDLDGVGKGWLADRALDRLAPYPAAVVDADGDVAVRLDPGTTWDFGVADPDLADHDLAILELTPRGATGARSDGRFGLATSGVSVHRWDGGAGRTHHLIDPRTTQSAVTDVIQATVLARTAREAEALAKTAVILGSDAGYDFLDCVGVDGAILVTDRRELLIHPATVRWLA